MIMCVSEAVEMQHLTIVTVRQQDYKPALSHPLRLAAAQELVKDHLRMRRTRGVDCF